jgi:hypothetical protein
MVPSFLLLRLNSRFYVDWENHVWLIGYFGEYFAQHHTFPVAIHTKQIVGMPFPVFYGFLFYPIAGLLSAVAGGNLALRIMIFLLLLIECAQVRKTIAAASGSARLGTLAALMTVTAVYPLTNLYNRGAITEFVALSLLVTSICLWLRIGFLDDEKRVWRNALLGFLSFAVSAGTHPITGVWGGALFGMVVLGVVLCAPRGPRLYAALTGALLLLVVLSPWLYSLAQFRSRLSIERISGHFNFYPDIDSFSARFSPVLFRDRPAPGTTPGLDAAVNVPLLVLAGYLLYEAAKYLVALRMRPPASFMSGVAAMAGFLALALVSTSERLLEQAPPPLSMLQFAYRLVGYLDLLLLIATALLLYSLRGRLGSIAAGLRTCLLIAGLLNATSFIMKYRHVLSAMQPGAPAGSGVAESRGALLNLPPTFYGSRDYAIRGSDRPAVDEQCAHRRVPLPVGVKEKFGAPGERNVAALEPIRVITNVLEFPWNRVFVNGSAVTPCASQPSAADKDLVVFAASAGTATIRYEFQPNAVWIGLRWISFAVLLLWAGATVVIPGNTGVRGVRAVLVRVLLIFAVFLLFVLGVARAAAFRHTEEESLAALTSPAPDSALPDSTVAFTWTAGRNVTKYRLDLGSAAGQGDISTGETTLTRKTVSTLPADGRMLYIRLWSFIDGSWGNHFNDYTAAAPDRSDMNTHHACGDCSPGPRP